MPHLRHPMAPHRFLTTFGAVAGFALMIALTGCGEKPADDAAAAGTAPAGSSQAAPSPAAVSEGAERQRDAAQSAPPPAEGG